MKTLNFKNVKLGYLVRTLRFMHTKNVTKTTGNQLEKLIVQKIKATGPITVAQYMKEVLVNPALGYYTTKDVFGRTGDFVTSPEVSQMFGELIGAWLFYEWYKVGAPQPLNLLELGPGRGTMMSDILRVFNRFKADKNMSVHLIEVSEVLAGIQAEKICSSSERTDSESLYYMHGKTKFNVPVYWYKNFLDSHLRGFTLTVAHEFFDALPVHKLQRTKNGWREILIDIGHTDASEQKLRYVLAPGETIISKTMVDENETRDELEVCPEGLAIMELIADRMERFGGIMLMVDYGHEGTKTDTFRAFRKHEQCNPLVNIGEADLTADVDFLALKKKVTPKLITLGPVPQRQFLKQMNIDIRLETLLKKADDKQKELLVSGYHMLTDEDKMGDCFSFVGFFPAVLESLFKIRLPVGFLNEKNKYTRLQLLELKVITLDYAAVEIIQ